jgi:hypothetical protein
MITFLTDPRQDIAPRNSVALVTIVVGAKYEVTFRDACLPSFARYAERHGYDLVVVQCLLDDGPLAQSRSIAWQKCLILNQPWSTRYRRIVWIDADIIINPDAPPIADACSETMIGACISEEQYSPADVHVITEMETGQRFTETEAVAHRRVNHRLIYLQDGHGVTYDHAVQTGVVILNPHLHNGIMMAAYAHNSQHRWYEQVALSLGILQSGLFERIPARFNWLLGYTMKKYFPPGRGLPRDLFDLVIEGEFRSAYFLHFCHDEAWRIFSSHPPEYARRLAG